MGIKGTKSLLYVALLSLLNFSVASTPSEVTVSKSFSANRLSLQYRIPAVIVSTDDTQSTITVNGALKTAIPGRWELPVIPVNILDGEESQIKDIEIIYSEWDTIPLQREPQRSAQYIPLSLGDLSEAVRGVPQYREVGFWPGEQSFPEIKAQKRGYSFSTLTLTPVRYNSEKKRLIVARAVSVEVTFKKRRVITPLFGPKPTDVVNGEQFSFTPATRAKGYLAISSSEILTAQTDTTLQDLLRYHESNGFTTYSESTESIAAKYPGRDLAEKIRACITDYYKHKGVSFVLLAGDTNVVPVRRLYVDDAPASRLDSIPSDIYYQCLDGDFDYDGDGIWGEKNDGVDGGFIDLYAEVYIGRIPAENSAELSHAVAKTLRFYAAPDGAKQTLTVGEKLGFGGLSEYSNHFLDEIWSGGSYNGYRTVGLESETGISQKKLLDFEKTWEDDNIADSINSDNYGIINHLGHGYAHLNMRLRTKNVDSLIRNRTPLFEYSQACLSGNLDEASIAEALLTANRHGLWAGVFNSRYGLGSFNSTNAPSQYLHRQFWDAYFGEEYNYLGELNSDSHEEAVQLAQTIWAYRWVIYTSNLLGDPAADLQLRNSEKKLVPITPQKGTIWEQERSFEILWYDNFKEQVTLTLVGATGESSLIAQDIPSMQKFIWKIPAATPTGTYQISFSSTALSTPVLSESFAIETKSTLELINPEGGEKWYKDSTVEIRWSDDVDEPLQLLVMDGESVVDTISKGTMESAFSWAVPRILPQSNSYRIRLQSSKKEWLYVESNPITIMSPPIKTYPYHFNPDTLPLGEDLFFWDQNRSDNFNWKVHTGQTPSKKQADDWWNTTGPSKDVSGNGRYIYAEATGNAPSKKAIITSPTFDISALKNGQLTFKYHMFCKEDFGNMGSLSLNLYIDGECIKNVVKMTGSKGDQWKEKVVDLSTYTGHEMRIEFTATTGKSFASDIALDDIRVTGESGNALPQFLTIPDTVAVVGKEYRYEIEVEDDDGSDNLFITLEKGASWLSLSDKGSGFAELVGQPTITDTGEVVIVVRTRDPQSDEIVQQEFVLKVVPQTSLIQFPGTKIEGVLCAPRIVTSNVSTLYITIPQGYLGKSVHLFDVIGNKVLQKKLFCKREVETIDISEKSNNLASGSYLLVLELQDQTNVPKYSVTTIAVKREL